MSTESERERKDNPKDNTTLVGTNRFVFQTVSAKRRN